MRNSIKARTRHKDFPLAGQFNQTNRPNGKGAPIDAEQEAGASASWLTDYEKGDAYFRELLGKTA